MLFYIPILVSNVFYVFLLYLGLFLYLSAFLFTPRSPGEILISIDVFLCALTIKIVFKSYTIFIAYITAGNIRRAGNNIGDE